jgi:hypothetical protein
MVFGCGCPVQHFSSAKVEPSPKSRKRKQVSGHFGRLNPSRRSIKGILGAKTCNLEECQFE